MNPTILIQLSLLGALAAYVASASQIAFKRSGKSSAWIILVYLAVLLHFAHAGIEIASRGSLNASFFEMFSVTALIVVLVALTAARDIPELFVPLNSVAALALLGTLLINREAPIADISNVLSAHIALSLIAYGVLCTAAITSVLLWLGDRSLRGQTKQRWLQSLPPLQRIESLMFHLISVGWILLTAGLVVGILGIDNFFAQHLAHKTVFSIISWLMFGGLLIGRQLQGWRGRIAIRWTLLSFCLLAVAFLGSKFVLDVILGRV